MPETFLHYCGLKQGQSTWYWNRRGAQVPVGPDDWVRLDLDRYPENRNAIRNAIDTGAAIVRQTAPPDVDLLDETTDANRGRNAFGKILGPGANGAHPGRPKYHHLSEQERVAAERLLTPAPRWTRSGPDKPFREEIAPSASDWFEARRLNGTPYLTREEERRLRQLPPRDLEIVAASLLKILTDETAACSTKERETSEPTLCVVYVDARRNRREHKRRSPIAAHRVRNMAILHRIAELMALHKIDKANASCARTIARRRQAVVRHRDETGFEATGCALAEINDKYPLPTVPDKKKTITATLRAWGMWSAKRAPSVATAQRWRKGIGVNHPSEFVDALILHMHENRKAVLFL